jgi:uncharacterized protein
VSEEASYRLERGRLLLRVKAYPQSGRARLEAPRSGEIQARLLSAPEDGKANKELTDLVAKALGLPKSEVSLLSGQTSRHKTLSMPESALGALEALISSFVSRSLKEMK